MTTEVEADQVRPILPFIIYLILLFTAWTIWVIAIYPLLIKLGDRSLTYALANNGLRILIWVVPVFLYLRFVDGVNPISYLGLRQHWKRGVAVGVVATSLNFLLNMVSDGMPSFNWDAITWNSVIGTSFLIGFVEEIPFRGFILQKLRERLSFWPANVVSSTLFLLIHFPGWIALHLFNLRTAAVVFVIGFVMAILFRYTRSLWSAIVAHSGNDLISVLLFHH
jgi:membrane protease YdiL (CAAX protease family)